MAEHEGVGTLKTVDGLFFVTNGEDRTLALARAKTCKKVSGQGPDDIPLIGAGVLSLID